MAERIGVSQSAFAQMESPEANPRIATLKKIAQAFGVEWEALQA
jgi:transcriptional regulator with XRE-family HTH domain